MAKEIPEDLKNYNKYPGEHVVQVGENQIKVGEKTFQLIRDYTEGFDSLALEQRYSGIFNKYDYLVGDWGHELLRLKGFYDDDRKNVPAEEKIARLADYLQEYCAYGCAYFILQRERQAGEVDEDFDEGPDESDYKPKKSRRNPRSRNNGRGKSRLDDALLTSKPNVGDSSRNPRSANNSKSGNNRNNKNNSTNNKENRNKRQNFNKNNGGKSANNTSANSNSNSRKKVKVENKHHFVIRERKD